MKTCVDPSTITEDDQDDKNQPYTDDDTSCPPLTCVLPIVLCIGLTVVVAAVVIGGVCLAK